MKKGPGEFRPERCAYRWQEHWKKRAGENDRFYEVCEVRIVDCQISGGFSTCARSGLQISVASSRLLHLCSSVLFPLYQFTIIHLFFDNTCSINAP